MAGRTSKQLTHHLRTLAAEAESVHDNGDIITKAEAMASLLWKYALGWEEPDPDDPGKTIMHRPQQWAISMIYERLEGKAPAAVEDTSGTMSVADRVSEAARNSLNAITLSVVGDDGLPSGPPPYRRNRDVGE